MRKGMKEERKEVRKEGKEGKREGRTYEFDPVSVSELRKA
jgi:hypothetical protein